MPSYRQMWSLYDKRKWSDVWDIGDLNMLLNITNSNRKNRLVANGYNDDELTHYLASTVIR